MFTEPELLPRKFFVAGIPISDVQKSSSYVKAFESYRITDITEIIHHTALWVVMMISITIN